MDTVSAIVRGSVMELALVRAQTFLRLYDPDTDDDFDVVHQGKRSGRVYFQPGRRSPGGGAFRKQ